MTPESLIAATGCSRQAAETFAVPLARAMQAWGIREQRDRAMFVAQCAHESAGFEKLEEDLWYSAPRLMDVWPRRFRTIDIANRYARNPEALANLVYANRMGNGDEASGDGWRYRGRGFGLTGRTNYTQYAIASTVPADMEPDLILQPHYAADSMGWFWWKNGVSKATSLEEATRIINGGLIGVDHRRQLLARAEGVDWGEQIA